MTRPRAMSSHARSGLAALQVSTTDPRPHCVGHAITSHAQPTLLCSRRSPRCACAQSYFNRIESSFEMLGFGDESRGSNNWLVAAEHTANGNPIMSNDPHLSLISPAVWWYCHLNTARMGGEGNMDVEGVCVCRPSGRHPWLQPRDCLGRDDDGLRRHRRLHGADHRGRRWCTRYRRIRYRWQRDAGASAASHRAGDDRRDGHGHRR